MHVRRVVEGVRWRRACEEGGGGCEVVCVCVRRVGK